MSCVTNLFKLYLLVTPGARRTRANTYDDIDDTDAEELLVSSFASRDPDGVASRTAPGLGPATFLTVIRC